MPKDTRARRELVDRLALTGQYRRSHTATGVLRRPPDGPPEVNPEVDTTGIRRRKANLKKPR
jgi:hypothetical protein